MIENFNILQLTKSLKQNIVEISTKRRYIAGTKNVVNKCPNKKKVRDFIFL